MRLKMLTGLSGADYCLSPGDEREFSDGEGARLVAAGFAEEVAIDPAAPVAPKPGRQKAVRIRPGKESR